MLFYTLSEAYRHGQNYEYKSVLASSSLMLHSSSERKGICMTGTLMWAHSLFFVQGIRQDTKNKSIHSLPHFEWGKWEPAGYLRRKTPLDRDYSIKVCQHCCLLRVNCSWQLFFFNWSGVTTTKRIERYSQNRLRNFDFRVKHKYLISISTYLAAGVDGNAFFPLN